MYSTKIHIILCLNIEYYVNIGMIYKNFKFEEIFKLIFKIIDYLLIIICMFNDQ